LTYQQNNFSSKEMTSLLRLPKNTAASTTTSDDTRCSALSFLVLPHDAAESLFIPHTQLMQTSVVAVAAAFRCRPCDIVAESMLLLLPLPRCSIHSAAAKNGR
jgi:hypothetical protein